MTARPIHLFLNSQKKSSASGVYANCDRCFLGMFISSMEVKVRLSNTFPSFIDAHWSKPL